MQRYEHGGDVYGQKEIRLDFSANLNPLGMPPGVRRALIDKVDSFQRYPDPHCRALRKGIAALHGLDEPQVLPGNGAADLIFRICACLMPKLALVTAPTFSEYERAVCQYGGQMRYHRLDADRQFDLDERILEAITPDIRLVFLCSPNNPTGRLIAPALIEQITDHCHRQGTVLVLDECFIDFTDGQSMIPALARHPNLLILRAFTKMYAMAGLRLGYLLAEDAGLINRIAGYGASWSVSGPAQAAGLAALREQGWVERSRDFVKEERAFMMEALQALELAVLPGAANYLLISSAQPLYQTLLARGILVRDCSNYEGLDGWYFRIGIQDRQRNLQLLAALKEHIRG